MGVEVCHDFKIKPKHNDAGASARPWKTRPICENLNDNLKCEHFGLSYKKRIPARDLA